MPGKQSSVKECREGGGHIAGFLRKLTELQKCPLKVSKIMYCPFLLLRALHVNPQYLV